MRESGLSLLLRGGRRVEARRHLPPVGPLGGVLEGNLAVLGELLKVALGPARLDRRRAPPRLHRARQRRDEVGLAAHLETRADGGEL